MNNEQKNTPKDVFLQLLGVLALYISAVSLITLLFQYVNLAFPDALEFQYYGSVSGPIRWSMASLMILFPVYLFVALLIHKDYKKFPEKKDSKIRKWLANFTLFVTAIAIIIDLVSLIYNFLGGELTPRFTLKVLIVLIVAGKIFWYYLWDLKQKFTPTMLRVFVWGVSAMMLASIVGGFFTVGSPLKARLYRFDETRINDLQMIQSQIIGYWQQKNILPKTLGDLKDDISGFAPAMDPEQNIPYEYKATGPLKFELCATFNLPSVGNVESIQTLPIAYQKSPMTENWNHDAGHSCFARVIDPDLYKPIPRY